MILFKAVRRLYRALQLQQDLSGNPLADLGNLKRGLESNYFNINPEILSRIRTAYLLAKKDQKDAPAEYQVGGEWLPILTRNWNEFNSKNFSEDQLSNLFRNKLSLGLITHSTYEDLARASKNKKKEFILKLLRDFELWKDLTGCTDSSILESPSIGNPFGYQINETLILPDACRHHYYSSRVCELLRTENAPVVAEIGGGYGGFAHYLLRDEAFKYVNYDIPEILILSSFYLMHAFPNKRFKLYGESDEICDIELLPNFMLKNIERNSIDLFFNTASLSEMNLETINEYLKHISRSCRKYFFHINSVESIFGMGAHYEISANDFPIDQESFKLLYRHKELFGGGGDRYQEFLYERIKELP